MYFHSENEHWKVQSFEKVATNVFPITPLDPSPTENMVSWSEDVAQLGKRLSNIHRALGSSTSIINLCSD